ncbi:MAG TPA: acyl-CoA thioesterase [Polyangiales bacterium]|nr:acyl-CoA thioesterase [Polyangiales bacterium]
MFLPFEYAKVLLGRDRAEPLGVFEPVRLELRAWPWLCDALGHVNNARYLDLADVGRLGWLARRGLLRKTLRQRSTFVIAGASLTYRRSIPRLAPFVLETQLVDFDERWLCFTSTFLLQDNGRELVAAHGVVRGQVRVRNKPARPYELIRTEGIEPTRPQQLTQDITAFVHAQEASLNLIRNRDTRISQ